VNAQNQLPVTISNSDDWSTIATQLQQAAGMQLLTLPMLTSAIGATIAGVFAADRSHDYHRLRGVLSDTVLAQRQQTAGRLQGAEPTACVVELVGVSSDNGQPVLRVHLAISVTGARDGEQVMRQFWQIAANVAVTVNADQCPGCGAPVADGAAFCAHCGAPVRSQASSPLTVISMDMY
jgi:hypothetical protein